MPSATPGDPRTRPMPSRRALAALLVTGAATAGIALHPGPALADPGPATLGSAAGPMVRTVLRTAGEPDHHDSSLGDTDAADEEEAPVDDGPVLESGEDEELSEDDPGLDDSGDESGSRTGAGGTKGSGSGSGSSSSAARATVAIDRRGRAVRGPRAFAASRTARASGLTWTSWGAASTTGRGRLVVHPGGRRARVVTGTGVVVLSRAGTCTDGTRVYRRAVLTVGKRRVATVTLPGCSARRR